jgi:hypothetical protein
MDDNQRRPGHKTFRGFSLPEGTEAEPTVVDRQLPDDDAVDAHDDVKKTIPAQSLAALGVPAGSASSRGSPPAGVIVDPSIPRAARVPPEAASPKRDPAMPAAPPPPPAPDDFPPSRGPAVTNDPDSVPRRGGTPLVEIEVIHEHGPAPSTDRPWRTVEVWTRNRIYVLDSHMVCIEVSDRLTRSSVGDHPFMGMRLVGGQHREGESIELSFPFPRPGTEAVFEKPGAPKGGSFSRTSAVTRVVLRLHIVTVAPNYVVPTWEQVSGQFAAPKIRKRGEIDKD